MSDLSKVEMLVYTVIGVYMLILLVDVLASVFSTWGGIRNWVRGARAKKMIEQKHVSDVNPLLGCHIIRGRVSQVAEDGVFVSTGNGVNDIYLQLDVYLDLRTCLKAPSHIIPGTRVVAVCFGANHPAKYFKSAESLEVFPVELFQALTGCSFVGYDFDLESEIPNTRFAVHLLEERQSA